MEESKVVLVTGGSRGLGRAIVENFAHCGYRVAFTYLKSEEDAGSICKEYGETVLAIKADASDFDRSFTVVGEVVHRFKRLDVLVNNVSLAKDRPIWELGIEDWDFTLKNTLHPCFNYTRAAVEFFMNQGKGKIINIGSINGMRGREGSVGYCTAKAGIIGFTKTLAKELGPYNINANVVAPGYIETDGQKNTSPLIKRLVLDECAIRRLSKPQEVAYLVEFLAGDKADNITGQVIQVDCGQYI